jgi:hypothetical protein
MIGPGVDDIYVEVITKYHGKPVVLVYRCAHLQQYVIPLGNIQL